MNEWRKLLAVRSRAGSAYVVLRVGGLEMEVSGPMTRTDAGAHVGLVAEALGAASLVIENVREIERIPATTDQGKP